jgi:hypothetical protein
MRSQERQTRQRLDEVLRFVKSRLSLIAETKRSPRSPKGSEKVGLESLRFEKSRMNVEGKRLVEPVQVIEILALRVCGGFAPTC